MAFRLSTGEETKAVPYRIVTGLPPRLSSIVAEYDNQTLQLLLRLPLIENTKSGLDFLASHESDVERQDLEKAAAIVEAKLAELRKLDLKKKLEDIDEDVFGAYFFRLPEIQILLDGYRARLPRAECGCRRPGRRDSPPRTGPRL